VGRDWTHWAPCTAALSIILSIGTVCACVADAIQYGFHGAGRVRACSFSLLAAVVARVVAEILLSQQTIFNVTSAGAILEAHVAGVLGVLKFAAVASILGWQQMAIHDMVIE
jgi:hypothetical protein